MLKIPEIFGCMVFNDAVMKERLPDSVYQSLKTTINNGDSLDSDTADVIASAMKDWAIEKGATHYTHWFQPMTGITAEKHDSFIMPCGDDSVIMNFSKNQLIMGEPDASSFPNGGLRSTFEARGYTAWDPTCHAFVKDGSLYIPTAFVSYGGQALDKKTPLLRSVAALSKQAKRILKLFNKEALSVTPTVGPEQEYFLIPEELYKKRRDLIFTGRTLLGAKPPKGQELEDHYFGFIKPRVLAYMRELDEELWKLGIYSKTRHNEAAPCQHELAVLHTQVNLAADHNQLVMELMRKTASNHGLVCLLHEKPFAGMNGSGKHNNWSMMTDKGENLLEPGLTPEDNLQFLLFLSAVIKAADEHQDLLRLSVATAGNDHRLGSNEAPPAIMSMFLGEDLTNVFEALCQQTSLNHKKDARMNTGVKSILPFAMDTTDRNRTSPFAFTGNKFEFRMLGSSINIACPNILLNTAVADALMQFADALETEADFATAAKNLIRQNYIGHSRIVFNGNNYSAAWEEEAKRRGLLNLKTAPEALELYDSPKNVALLERHNVYTRQEIKARKDILLENYCKIINIEALTLSEIISRDILPAATGYCSIVCDNISKLERFSLNTKTNTELIKTLTDLIEKIYTLNNRLQQNLIDAKSGNDMAQIAKNYCNIVRATMQSLRIHCDTLETILPRNLWPIPTYGDMLFY